MHDKAIILIEGGIVKIDGLFVKAKKYNVDFDICNYCEMDSLCHGDITVLCSLCDTISQKKVMLYLPNPKK